MSAKEMKLLLSVRNTAEIKIDLLKNEADGWLVIRWWRLEESGDVKVKVIGISPGEWSSMIQAVKDQ